MSSKEYTITYDPSREKEMLPSPKFEGIYWQGIPEQDQIVGEKATLNGERFVMEVVGFQGSDKSALVVMHQEKSQKEGAFFIVGKGEMEIWNGMECQRRPDEPNITHHPLIGILTMQEAEKAKYTLAIASAMNGVESLVLNVETVEGKHVSIEGVWNPIGYHHGTTIEGQSLYFVVKMSRSTPDVHELVGYTGPYGGGGD